MLSRASSFLGLWRGHKKRGVLVMSEGIKVICGDNKATTPEKFHQWSQVGFQRDAVEGLHAGFLAGREDIRGCRGGEQFPKTF